jgi:hypothetical protein
MSSAPHDPADRRDPVRWFLGIADPGEDPRTLLGVEDGPFLESDVLDALRGRLAQIDAHADANTMLADELRLRLHAAAARLLIGAGDAGTHHDASDASLRSELLRAVGMSGGWNRDALRRVTMLAQAHGIEPTYLLKAVADLTRPQPAPMRLRPAREGAAPAAGEGRATDRRAEGVGASARMREVEEPSFDAEMPSDDTRAVKKFVLLVGAGMGVVVLLAIVGVLVIVGSATPGVQAPDEPTPGSTASDAPVQPAAPAQLFPAPARVEETPPPARTAQRLGDFTDVLREVQACVAGMDVDPAAALDRFAGASRRVEGEWLRASSDAIVASVAAQVEFIYRASANQARGVQAVRAALPAESPGEPLGAADIAALVWRGGLASRLMRERDLPSPVRDAVREAFARVFEAGAAPAEPTFRAGALGVLAGVPLRILPEARADEAALRRAEGGWDAYLACARALQQEGEALEQRVGVQALDRLLRDAPEPLQSRAVFDGVTRLASALSWREGDATRGALLGWFESPGVSTSDLHAVTSALATRSGAVGVDFTMVLSPGASDAQRAELRDRYANVWGVAAGPTRSELLDRWIEQAQEALRGAEGGTPLEDLARALRAGRLNEIAWMLWGGRSEGVGALLAASTPSAPGVSTIRDDAPALGRSDADVLTTTWAVRYLNAGQGIPARREILNSISQPPSPLEADIIAEEAVRGSPVQVRSDARLVVLRYSGEPAMVNALLEQAPTMPASRENTDLLRQVTLAQIPSPRDPAWRVSVRRALVERLTQLIADQGELAFVDRAHRDLAASYRARLLDASSPAEPPPVETSAGVLRARLRGEAEGRLVTGREPVSLAELDARYAARVRVASGRVQVFAVEQVSACELLAYIVASERADAAAEARRVLQELDLARAGSRHIFTQVSEAERAMLRLWLLRLGGSPA